MNIAIWRKSISRFIFYKKLNILIIRLPKIEATPVQNLNMPNEDVKASNPNNSTITIEANDIKAETERPRNKATTMNKP